jgi:hypothetical protein
MLTNKRKSHLSWLIWALIFAPNLASLWFPIAQAQDKCTIELAEAERKFQEEGRFDEAIDLLLGCLSKGGLTIADSARAYHLLAKVYYAKQLLKESHETLEKLLHLVPDWKPNPAIDTPPFQKLADEVITAVEQERKQQEEETLQKTPPVEPAKIVTQAKKGGGKKWLWIGLGTAALSGGAVAVLAGGGKNGGPPTPPVNRKLPDPPGSPGGN